jgi:hypothetical protein
MQGKSWKLEKSCESWELPESKKQREPKTQGTPKKQGKSKHLWEPWERLKPLEPGVQEKLSLQVVR